MEHTIHGLEPFDFLMSDETPSCKTTKQYVAHRKCVALTEQRESYQTDLLRAVVCYEDSFNIDFTFAKLAEDIADSMSLNRFYKELLRSDLADLRKHRIVAGLYTTAGENKGIQMLDTLETIIETDDFGALPEALNIVRTLFKRWRAYYEWWEEKTCSGLSVGEFLEETPS